VQRGDSLARVAPLYDLTYQELQLGNCLLNPNNLRPGDVLRVPAPNTTSPTSQPSQRTQPPLAGTTLPPNATVIVVPAYSDTTTALTADDTTLTAGECTTLRWSVSAGQVYLDEQPVSSSGVRQVCPTITTVYTLRTVNPEATYTTAVFVE
jgi:LysM repeat protein